jgi:serine/threonine protein kinase
MPSDPAEVSDARALTLLDELLDLEDAGRAMRLEQIRTEDPALHERVSRLLKVATSDEGSRVLAGPVYGELRAAQRESLVRFDSGQIISGYRLLRPIGRGGTSVVWLGERADGAVKREVAVKLPSFVFTSDTERERFVREKDLLAAMEHTYIARLYDAGIAESGQPFLVLEYVDGKPITAHCDEHRLNIHERLRLFLQVLDAIGYAHSRLVVHRDIKPSNILVDARGQTRLVDFGIAKALGDSGQDDAHLTRHGQVIGTPHYMSPEQAGLAAPDIDTRTDIYSLGAVLYELLCGALPLELHRLTDHEIGQALRDRDPAPPSRRLAQLADAAERAALRGASVSELRKTLQGDLDLIVMKAIAKDRAARYQTARELAVDIGRYLDRLPVLARPPTVRYVVGRFVRRNRLLVGASALAFIALLTGSIVATVGLMQAREAQRRASIEAETSQQVATFLVDLFAVSDPSEARGNTITAREVLDKGAGRIESELGDQPAVRSQLLFTIARVYRELGLYRDAMPLAEQSLSLRRAALPGSTQLADSLDQVGQLHSLLSRHKDALPFHDEAIAIRQGLDPRPAGAMSESHALKGVALMQDRQYQPALQSFLEAQRLLQVAIPAATPLQRARLAENIAQSYHYLDRLAEAEPFYRQAIATLRSMQQPDHPVLAESLADLAVLLKDTGRLPESEQLNAEALAIYRKTLGGRHPRVASLLNNIAMQHVAARNLDAALIEIQEALAIDRESLGDNHQETNIVRLNLARIHYRRNELSAAEREIRVVLDTRRDTLPADHLDLGVTLDQLAAVLNKQRRYAEAARAAEEAREILLKAVGPEHSRTASANISLGNALCGLRRFEESEAALLSAHDVAAKSRGRYVGLERNAVEGLIGLYDLWEKPARADEYRAMLRDIDAR